MFQVVTFLAGICGFAYEILLNRTLTTMFGSISYLQGVILFSFILFAGIGALVSDRAKNHLDYILLALGVFSFLLSFLWNDYLLLKIISDQDLVIRAILTILIIAPGALLIGTIIPILTDLKTLNENSNKKQSFLFVYLAYHIGAGIILISLDLWWIPIMGIKSGFILLGVIILIVLLILKLSQVQYTGKVTRGWLTSKEIYLISIISLISGFIQFGVLKTHYHFFGPFPENFTFMIATSILSLGLSSIIVKRYKLKKNTWLKALPLLLVSYLFYLWAGIHAITYINDLINFETNMLNKIIRFAMMFTLYSPIYILFGLLLPCFHERDNLDTKTSIALNSIFNAIGFILSMFILHQLIPLKILFLFCSIGIIAFLWVKNEFSNISILISLVLIAIWTLFFNSTIFHLSYTHFGSPKNLEQTIKMTTGIESFRKAGSEVSLLNTLGGKIVVIDGYRSLRISKTDNSLVDSFEQINLTSGNKYEFVMGALQAFLSQKKEKSLILGVGSGITITANSMFFQNVDAVEINPVIMDMQEMLTNYNYGLLDKKNVNLFFDDGFNFLLKNNQKYDLIVNNVPTPRYSVAAKIWTQEFIEIIYNKLNSKGVFSVWLNAGINDKSTNIILKTISQKFSNCYIGVLHPLYSNLMCIKSQLPEGYIESVKLKHNKSISGTSFNNLKFLLFPIKSFKNLHSTPVNSLNKPTLPYYLDAKFDKLWKETPPWYLFDKVNIDWNMMSDFRNENIKKRCQVLKQWLNGFNAPFCENIE